jgi:hypothetical protein
VLNPSRARQVVGTAVLGAIGLSVAARARRR